MKLTRISNGELEELEVSYRIDHGQAITVCPPMPLPGCYDLRNRGLNLDVEVTMWPRYFADYGMLHTAGYEPCAVHTTSRELWMLARLSGSESQFTTLREGWREASESKKAKVNALQGTKLRRSAAYREAEKILSGGKA